uniref:alkaline phosphatase D family protein n=1 Tax=Rubinisphaera italica TaxID=2527969 RepID=UPI0013EF256E|nr:alkaline phosphatase D family protein [Rubinisphaera italica]
MSETSAKIWFRPDQPGQYKLLVSTEDGESYERAFQAEASETQDLCITWVVTDLKPETHYQYSIIGKGTKSTEVNTFVTAPNANSKKKICLAFGSCADMASIPLWTQMEERGSEGLVLLGDTPYIDTTDLKTAREKHRQFLTVPELAKLIRHIPTWGTWDDHDFGRNDSDGRLPGKENTRQAFVEYRANDQFGQDSQGIYTKFRYGPTEVFLLDTRWFSRTEPSPVAPDKPTLLGKIQWEWLKESLRSSDAEFKIIACGMIWDDKENTESDDWGTYSHEREALFEFIGDQKISGVVLIGGDIHCSRLLKYKTEAQVGYPIHQFIVSPIHHRTIPKLNVPHPDLIKGAAIPHVWLRLEVDSTREPAQLHAEWVQMDGQPMWDITLDETELRRD